MKLIRIGLFVLLFSFITVSCNREDSWKIQANYFAQHSLNVDSIVDFASQQDPLEIRPYMSQAFSRFHFNNDSIKANELLEKIEQLNDDSDSLWIHTSIMNRLFRSLWNQDENSFNVIFQELNQFQNSKDTVFKINIFNAAGSMKFATGDLDSAYIYFSDGLMLAQTIKSQFDIMQLASNVGTIFFYKSMPGLASQYFSLAVDAMEKTNTPNPMLVNNVISALGEEGKHKESLAYFESHKSILRGAYDIETRNTISINYAAVLSNLGQFETSQLELDSLNWGTLSRHLKMEFIQLQLRIFSGLGDQEKAYTFLNNKKDFIWKESPECMVRIANPLTEIAKSWEIDFDWSRLNKMSKTWLNSENLDVLDKMSLLKLLQVGPYRIEEKNYFLGQYKDQHYNYLMQSDSVRNSNMQALVTIGEIRRDRERLKSAIHVEKERNFRYKLIAVFATFLLVFLGVNIIQWRKNRIRLEKKLKLRLELEQERKNSVQQEKRYLERIRLMSESLISKSEKWSEQISISDFAKNPVALQIRRELKEIATLGGNFNLEPQKESRIDLVEEALKQFPELDDLSHTAKEVVLLSISGQKPREIAKLLSLNEQYIRNLKSSAKKRLEPRLGTSFRWDDLAHLDS